MADYMLGCYPKPWHLRDYTGPAFIDVGVGTPEKINIKDGLMIRNGYSYCLYTYPTNLSHECTMFLLIPWYKENPDPCVCRERLGLIDYKCVEKLESK